MTCLAIMTTTWGQVDASSERDTNSEQYIFAIRDVWADHSIRVENMDPNARIRSFAKAFCSMYQEYRPNEAMTDYLKNPGIIPMRKSIISWKTPHTTATSCVTWVGSSTIRPSCATGDAPMDISWWES